MTTEENDRVEETAVADNPPEEFQEHTRTAEDNEDRSEVIKFVLLVLVFLVIIIGVALARPFIFGHVIPAIMGANLTPTPAVGVGGAGDETPETGGDVFLPALTSDQAADESGSETAVDSTPEPTPETAVTVTPEPVTHVVQPGETLTRIAQQYNVTTQALMEANNLQNPNYIQVGQILIIPTNP